MHSVPAFTRPSRAARRSSRRPVVAIPPPPGHVDALAERAARRFPLWGPDEPGPPDPPPLPGDVTNREAY